VIASPAVMSLTKVKDVETKTKETFLILCSRQLIFHFASRL
jgi:hypothetical protein